jgi:cytochrome o ubiquinol oxidase subunit 1
MMGRITLDAIPFYSAIAMGGALITVFGGLVVIAIVTWYRAWGYLWRNWLTSLDHKRIGIMYIALALIMLMRGFIDAIMMRMPLFTWTALVTAVLMVFAFPALTVAAALLGLDRLLGMHFFTNAAGGNMMNYANLFWMWGHPEVYILILPAFGIYSEVVATFSGKRLFGYPSLVYATAVIGVLSFTVWLHHFFTMGASANVNAFFGMMTMIIAVPTGVKIYDWLFTMFRGRIRLMSPMYWTIGFIVTFVIGGVTGVLLAIPPVDYLMHNTTFLVAHFHNMLIPGALFGYLAGYMFWFPKATGFQLDEKWGKRAFWAWIIGFYLAFMPLYILGFMGMPRRMEHYHVASWQPWLLVAELGAIIVLVGIICLIVQFIVSVRNREAFRDKTGDPWDGRTLEWATTSPPAPYNFAVIPEVDDRDAFMAIKNKDVMRARKDEYAPIVMPDNSGAGAIMGGLAFVFGFAMVWYIWWLAIASFAVILGIVVVRAFNDRDLHVLSSREVAEIETHASKGVIK